MEISIFIQKTIQENPYEPVTIGVTVKKEISDKADYTKAVEKESEILQITIDDILAKRIKKESSERVSKRGSSFNKRES